MTALTLDCPHCRRVMSVAPQMVGQMVVCPHCQQPLLAGVVPSPAVCNTSVGAPPGAGSHEVGVGRVIPDAAWNGLPSRRDGSESSPDGLKPAKREAAESIFSESDEQDDCLFGPTPGRRPALTPIDSPVPADNSAKPPEQPADRISGVAPLSGWAEVSGPASAKEEGPIVLGDPIVDGRVATAVSGVSPELEILSAPDDPFAMSGGDVERVEKSAAKPKNKEKAATKRKVGETSPAGTKFDIRIILIIAISVYALFMTIIAAWGWLRTPTVIHRDPPAIKPTTKSNSQR